MDHLRFINNLHKGGENKMTEQERNKRLDEIGREIVKMFPGKSGSVTFDFSNGKLAGIRDEYRRRPSPPADSRY
jgi:hypothetical protein